MRKRNSIASSLLGPVVLCSAVFASHVEISPDGRQTAVSTSRPATAEEARDLRVSPDGWVQEEPRASYTLGTVPYPLAPDWVGTRTRAIGGLAFGDADGDGDLDLAVGTYFANQFPPLVDYYNFIYLNDGGVLESEPSWISSDQRHTTAVRWAKLDGDGYPDLFVANGGESLHPSQVFYGTNGLLPTTAGWASATSTWAIDAAAADFDGDGDIDVATANQGNTVDPYRPTYLFRNTGTGLETTRFWQSAQIGITNSVAWGDMDGDGRLDLAAAGWSSWQTGVWRNLGTTLTTEFVWTTGQPGRTDKGIGWADVNGDSRPDLAVGGNGGSDWLFLNEGTTLGAAPVWASTEAYHGCQDLAWEDVDRDGDLDLATINFGNGHTRIYLNSGDSLSTVADWLFDDSSSGTALAFGDIDADGMPDLAVGPANGPVKVFINTGTPVGVPERADDLPKPGALDCVAAPNPFTDRLVVSVRGSEPFVLEKLSLFDASGRRVAQTRPSSRDSRMQTVSWNLVGRARMAAGVYFVRAETRGRAGARIATARVVRRR